MPKELRYRYRVNIPMLGRDSYSVDAKDDFEAVRKVIFRQLGKKMERPSIMFKATEVYENESYSVLDKTPLYGDVFDIDKLKQWEKDIKDVQDTIDRTDDRDEGVDYSDDYGDDDLGD